MHLATSLVLITCLCGMTGCNGGNAVKLNVTPAPATNEVFCDEPLQVDGEVSGLINGIALESLDVVLTASTADKVHVLLIEDYKPVSGVDRIQHTIPWSVLRELHHDPDEAGTIVVALDLVDVRDKTGARQLTAGQTMSLDAYDALVRSSKVAARATELRAICKGS